MRKRTEWGTEVLGEPFAEARGKEGGPIRPAVNTKPKPSAEEGGRSKTRTHRTVRRSAPARRSADGDEQLSRHRAQHAPKRGQDEQHRKNRHRKGRSKSISHEEKPTHPTRPRASTLRPVSHPGAPSADAPPTARAAGGLPDRAHAAQKKPRRDGHVGKTKRDPPKEFLLMSCYGNQI